MTPSLKVYQCIGCGAVEAPAECIGVCQYRAISVVDLASHERSLLDGQRQSKAERSLIWQLAHSDAKPGREAELLAYLQARARDLVGGQGNEG